MTNNLNGSENDHKGPQRSLIRLHVSPFSEILQTAYQNPSINRNEDIYCKVFVY